MCPYVPNCDGYPLGLSATPETLIYMRNLLPKGTNWAAFGIAHIQMPMVTQTTLLGGNPRWITT